MPTVRRECSDCAGRRYRAAGAGRDLKQQAEPAEDVVRYPVCTGEAECDSELSLKRILERAIRRNDLCRVRHQ